MGDSASTTPELYAMNGGDGRFSYAKNSFLQGHNVTASKGKIGEAIAEKLDLEILLSTSKTIRIVDVGCSVGPNTFLAIQSIIESIERKYQAQELNINQKPEFQVFFNDLTSNDFNTLFSSLPPDRQYFAAGVPGSFHGRLFPEGSIHFFYSCIALHILSKVPEELLDKSSPSWNRGRIHYINAPDEVVNAYATQYAKGIEIFLDARAKEMVPGGMAVMIFPANPTGIPYSQTFTGAMFELLESSILDLAREGKISEAQVDSFNLPMYVPSLEEMMELVQKNGCFDIEKMELTSPGVLHESMTNTSSMGKAIVMHVRAGMERMLIQHFGSEIIDELFNRYARKFEEFPHHVQPSKKLQLFVVLIRK
ncbi:loganic acid O-methyltransferase [Populus alba]|nr:loganic acid O-methyltransferase-like [Populus alba]KAJ6951551.1 loganic acid O-methyltransferase-like [Populus alba x Populus x berolinensis]TKR91471.1 putative S-adenosylmethionine-dependent methyltransferase [Populus alba]